MATNLRHIDLQFHCLISSLKLLCINSFFFVGKVTKEKEKRGKKTLKTGLSLGHQASRLTSTPMGEHAKKSHLILKSARAWPRNLCNGCPLEAHVGKKCYEYAPLTQKSSPTKRRTHGYESHLDLEED